MLHDLEQVRKFYSSLPESAIVGIEASTRAAWFENMLFETKHKLLVGNPVLIRKRATSRHKNDRRDAELILELLMRGEFPVLWRRPRARAIRCPAILRLRLSLVQPRTQIYNRLQALAHNAGLPKGRMKTAAFQALIQAVDMDEAGDLGREHLFGLLVKFNAQIAELKAWLKARAAPAGKMQLLSIFSSRL